MQKKITYREADLVYHDKGHGPVVVLIHGFAEDHSVWSNLIGALGDYRLIIPDLPGSGNSGLHKQLTIESMAEAVLAILQAEGISDTIMIGHSMGGYVTLAIVEQHPELIQAFGLFHSTAFADSEEKKNVRRKNIQFIRSHGSYEFLRQSLPGLFSESFKKGDNGLINKLIEQYRHFSTEALIAYHEAMINRPDRTQVLVTTSKPVLFIIGKHDGAVPFEDSLKLCHLPSLSYIHILDQTGHMGMFEEPENAANILKNFINDVTVNTLHNG